MRLIVSVALAVALLVQPAVALASGCGVKVVTHGHAYNAGHYGTSYNTSYHAQAVKYDVYPIAVYVPVPLFTTAPQPKEADVTADLKREEKKELLEVLRGLNTSVQGLNARLGAVEERLGLSPVARPAPRPVDVPQTTPTPVPPANPAPIPPAPADPFAPGNGAQSSLAPAAHPGLAALGARCIACHDKSAAAEKGGNLAYFADGRFAANARARAKMAKAIEGGDMPPASAPQMTAQQKADALAWLRS
jgi:hypothetical protein